VSGLCETCIAPGNCCKRVNLSGGSGMNQIDAPMSFERAEHMAMRYGLPFRPAEQETDGTWRWWCPALARDGRCSIYETRPQLCRDYRAGSDGLCAHYWPDPDDARVPDLKKAVEPTCP
jgi:Fe-S-cluster containining protein